ncbi:MAG: AI-2E family transporter [Anaerococcus sp.]|nr:AI-2E family transporter [Anaerococcus sp.]
MRTKSLYQRFIIRILIIFLLIGSAIFILPVLLDTLMPIILAILMALIISPVVKSINKGLPVGRKFISFLVGSFLLIVLLLFSFWIFQLIISQVIGLISSIIRNWSKIERASLSFIDKLSYDVKLLPPMAVNIINTGIDSIRNTLANLQANVFNMTFYITSSLINTSSSIIFFAITFITAFYIILADFTSFTSRLSRSFSRSSKESFRVFNQVLKASTVNYIKSQLLLSLICFLVSIVSLYFLDQDYLIIIALIIAFVDILPLVGTVIVLIPWAIVEILIFSNLQKGLVLIGLAIVWQLIRQIISPKIIGQAADIHPLISTIALYAGLRMGGVLLAIFAPVIAIFIVGIIKSGLLDNWFYDFREVFFDIKDRLDIKKRKLKAPKN